MKEQTTMIREVLVNYGGPKYKTSQITEPGQIADFFRKVIPENSREFFLVMFLDASNKPVGYSVAGAGIANRCLVHPAEIFRKALLGGAVSIMVAHNHPSGEVQPSKADEEVTRQLVEAGKVLGIKVVDHVIFTDEEYYSFHSDGKIY